jgi:hypothetical protein
LVALPDALKAALKEIRFKCRPRAARVIGGDGLLEKPMHRPAQLSLVTKIY